MAAYRSALFWFRRDLRLDDNVGLYQALRAAQRVHCAFVFDRAILGRLPRRDDRRVEFIHGSVAELARALEALGGGLHVLHADARNAIPDLAARLEVDAVFANGDYEPFARGRDAAVEAALARQGRQMHLAKDQALFEKSEILNASGRPFTVFTPYRNAWRKRLDEHATADHDVAAIARGRLAGGAEDAVPGLEALGFERTNLHDIGLAAGMSGGRAALQEFAARIDRYADDRDFPARPGASRLSVHNRFGTVSVRALARLALSHGSAGAEKWLAEIAWRDFFFQLLWHFPRIERSAFRSEFDTLEWPGGGAHLEAWKQGRTGYPLVDAAMRELLRTGYMHNRLRMVAASFLVKDLLVDWRAGQDHFADWLNDFDLAANNGGWQWAASTGCDPQPYFRIFNPVTQSERFDPEGRFIRAALPELSRVPPEFVHAPWTMPEAVQAAAGCIIGRDYPGPVVDHAEQRRKALALFGAARR